VLQLEVRSALKLTAFLTGLRGMIDQTAPGMTMWSTHAHNDRPYVKIAPAQAALGQGGNQALEKLAVYYAVTPTSWVLTLREDLLKRVLDRQTEQQKARTAGQKPDIAGAPWLGEHLGLQANAKALTVLEQAFGDEYLALMQTRSWGNIPILNELHAIQPDADAVAVYEKLWKTRLVCPGGGRYQWNEKWHTYESTVYGHPAEHRKGDAVPPVLRQFVHGNFGVTFENDGLRARARFGRKPAAAQ